MKMLNKTFQKAIDSGFKDGNDLRNEIRRLAKDYPMPEGYLNDFGTNFFKDNLFKSEIKQVLSDLEKLLEPTPVAFEDENGKYVFFGSEK